MPNVKPEQGRKTSFYVLRRDEAWLAFQSQRFGSLARYLNRLIESDLLQAMASDGEQARRYRAYLEALGRDEDLEQLGHFEELAKELVEEG